MPEPTSESSRINYGQRDETSRRLWETQIGKANPWEHRTPHDEDEAPPEAPPAPEPDEPPPMIGQRDRLRLKREREPSANPFEALIENRLNIQLPKP